MSIPKIIHTCAIGGYQISALGRRCMESWSRVMPECEIKVWTDENYPHSDWTEAAIRAKRPINASHHVQMRILHEFGGVFLDNDVELIRPFDMNQGGFIGFQRDDTWEFSINNAVVGAVPGQDFIKKTLRLIEAAPPDSHPIQTGPGMLTVELRRRGLIALNVEQCLGDLMVYSKDRFYPWSWLEKPDRTKITDKTFAAHHWEGSWLPQADIVAP